MKNFKLFNYLLLTILIGFNVNIVAQDNMLCMGHHWSEDKANRMMKQFENNLG
ncbi:MAG: hypothetical protein V5A59_12815 [Bacteroidales bacterium]